MNEYILFGLIVLGFICFAVIFRWKNKAMQLLKVKIGSSDGYSYQVHFEKLHPEMKDIEYVRMILCYTAKILNVIQKEHYYVEKEIIEYIKNVSKTRMDYESIKSFTQINIQETEPKSKVIEGILFFKNVSTRYVITKLPIRWYEYQLAHSIIALLCVSVKYMEAFQKDILAESLRYMIQEYEKGVDLKNFMNAYNLPNAAFLSRYST